MANVCGPYDDSKTMIISAVMIAIFAILLIVRYFIFYFSFASVYISKEIIQAKDRGKYTIAEIENHFIKALTKPTGKDRGVENF